jgi:5-methylcytosine-specific restriction enzyme subunit McrC
MMVRALPQRLKTEVPLRTVQLTEGQPTFLGGSELTESDAVAIAASKLVDVEFPSPINGRKFVLRSTATVGLIPVSRGLLLRVIPKVPVSNVFGMLEVVHQLRTLRFYDGIGQVEALEDVYSRVASIFARRVMNRVRRGLYASYLNHEVQGTVARGRINVVRSLRAQAGGEIRLHCETELQSIDNEDNQIVLCALDRIPRLGLHDTPVIREVRAARRALLGAVTLTQVSAQRCVTRTYNRLNADYAGLHALARFFLERMGPGLNAGDHSFLPFTVDMALLFQEYVVACLRAHAPPELVVSRQFAIEPEGDFKVRFSIDAVIRDRASGNVLAVVDAKYKRDNKPAASDVEQVIAYATQTGSGRAFLIYPFALPTEGRIVVGRAGQLHVSTTGFPLDMDLASTAKDFAQRVFSRL